jgi:hypothetical protein
MSALLCSTPAALSVGYHTKSVGMTYDRTLFGMKLTDCRCLAQALTCCETLTQLSLAGNCLDDDKVRMLASGLMDNISITHLDLSHNKVGAARCTGAGTCTWSSPRPQTCAPAVHLTHTERLHLALA